MLIRFQRYLSMLCLTFPCRGLAVSRDFGRSQHAASAPFAPHSRCDMIHSAFAGLSSLVRFLRQLHYLTRAASLRSPFCGRRPTP